MAKVLSALKFVFGNFGPLIFFYGTNHLYGLKPAILVSTVFSLGDIAWKVYHKQKVTSLFKFSAGTTLVFGMIDLYAKTPFLIKYEAVVTNVFTGIFFGASLRAERTVIEEAATQNPELAAKPITPDLKLYFRVFTGVWTLYFFAKACVYYWLANRYSIEQAMLIRTTFGTASLYVLVILSTLGGKPLFKLARARGWIPPETSAETAPPAQG